MLAHRVDRDHVRMGELRQRDRLAAGALDRASGGGGAQLQGDVAMQHQVMSAVDRAHATDTDRGVDAEVTVDRLALREHRRRLAEAGDSLEEAGHRAEIVGERVSLVIGCTLARQAVTA